MSDVHTPKQRAYNMSRIRGRDTTPEVVLRKRLHRIGFRYRLHDKKLPGKPDVVLPKYNAVILINGCFWHYHKCRLFKMPETRQEWWKTKLERTQQKDQENIRNLLASGWRVLVVWECAFRKTKKIDPDRVDCVLTLMSIWIKGQVRFKEIKGKP